MPLTQSGGTRATANRQPCNRIRQLLAGHRERPGNGRRDGDAQIDQVGRRAAGDLRLHMADAQSQTDQRRGSNHRQNAEANGDGGTSDQFSIADSQAKSQAEDGVHQRSDYRGPDHNRRAVGDQPEAGDHRRADQKNKKQSDGLDEAIRAS